MKTLCRIPLVGTMADFLRGVPRVVEPEDGFISRTWRNTVTIVGDWANEMFFEEQESVDDGLSVSLSSDEQRSDQSREEASLVSLGLSEDSHEPIRYAREALSRRGNELSKLSSNIDKLEAQAAATRSNARAVRESVERRPRSSSLCCF